MQMFQPGDDLGLGLEAADEVGLVGELRVDDFEGHFAVEQRLEGAVDGPETARPEAFTQLVALEYLPTALVCRGRGGRAGLRAGGGGSRGVGRGHGSAQSN